MKKIGILTFHNANNYGAVLQSYSLCRFINKFSKCEVIDYRNSEIELMSSHKRYYSRHRNLLGMVMSICMKKTFEERGKLFDDFRKKYIKISGRIKGDKEELKELNYSYAAFITGSDQVWNLFLTKNDLVYFLDFVEDKNKRYSYAASIGDYNALSKNEICICELMKFRNISVREQSFVKRLEEDYRICAKSNIDPVFLLDRDEWDRIEEEFKKNKYVLYFVNGKCNDTTYNVVKKIAKDRHLTIYYMANEDRIYHYPNLKHLRRISPTKFISIIKNADFIVTDSFHVTAFSIIYEKEFLYDDYGFYNLRIIDLLALFQINGRRISDFLNMEMLKKIDWSLVRVQIKKEKIKAERYFREMVSSHEINKK